MPGIQDHIRGNVESSDTGELSKDGKTSVLSSDDEKDPAEMAGSEVRVHEKIKENLLTGKNILSKKVRFKCVK